MTGPSGIRHIDSVNVTGIQQICSTHQEQRPNNGTSSLIRRFRKDAIVLPSQTICAYQEDASVFCGSGVSIMQSQSQIPNLMHISGCNSGHGDAKPVESHSAAIVNGNSSRPGGYWIGSPSFELPIFCVRNQWLSSFRASRMALAFCTPPI